MTVSSHCVWLLCDRELRAVVFFATTVVLTVSLHLVATVLLASYPSDSKDSLGFTLLYTVAAPATITVVIYLLGGFQDEFLGV